MKNLNSQAFKTLDFIKKISDYRSRYQPIELQLQKDGGLKKQMYFPDENQFQKKHELKNISIKGIASVIRQNVQNKPMNGQAQQSQLHSKNVSQVMQIDHDGLIGEITFCSNQSRRSQEISNLDNEQKNEIEQFCELNQIKVMICITMYSEPLSELQKSLEGIKDSLQDFFNNDILPNQILVVVIFDGIENIRNQGDENGYNQQDDIIPYFCQLFDKQNSIEHKKTLENQYKLYKFKKELINLYSQEQRKQFLQKTDEQKKLYFVNDKYLAGKMKYKKGQQLIDENVVEFMKKEYDKAKEYIELRQNNAYVYQSTQKIKLEKKEEAQMPIFHVFKFANGTKLSSHLWFFKGFCHEFQPQYCVLMDCGAKPLKGSVFNLIKELIDNDQVGGVCGTMTIELSKSEEQKGEFMDIISKILNVDIFNIERCQKCEYDIGNLLDKQFESALNFIQVLPGAYSAYRYKAFSTKYQKKDNNDNKNNNDSSIMVAYHKVKDILNYYLKSKLDPNYEHETLEEANMFLAEDRVLCLYLFCNGYYLKYVRNALVEVDPPQNMISLLLQRRRWINGSHFALNYVIKEFGEQLPNSGHTPWDKFLFRMCLVFARISQLTQYFVISLQMVWLYMVINALTENLDRYIAEAIKQTVIGFYVFLVFCLIYLSLNYNISSVNLSKTKEEKENERKQINQYYYSKFYGISTILGLMSLLNAAYSFYILVNELIVKNSPFRFTEVPQDLPSYIYFIVFISVILTVLPFILQLFIDRKLVFQIAINSIHYIYYMPTYTHLFITYSFCRIDDLTWGTKGLTSETESKSQNNKESNKKYQKYKFVVVWILSNVLVTLIFYLLFQLKIENIMVIIILSIGVILCIVQFVKFIGFCKYWLQTICQCQKDNKVHDSSNETSNNEEDKIKKASIRNKKYKDTTKLLYLPNFQDVGQSQINH